MLDTLLRQNQDARDSYASSLPAWRSDGLCNEVWRIESLGYFRFVKASDPARSRRQQAAHNHRAAVPVAPALLAHHAGHQWIAAAPGQHCPHPDPHQLTQLGRCLRQLHDSRARFQGEIRPQELLQSEHSHPPLAQASQQLLATAPSSVPTVPLHCDLNPGNVLFGAVHPRTAPLQAVHLIDWDYSGNGPAAWDLASACIEFHLNPAQRRDLLTAYAGRAPGGKLRHWNWYLAAFGVASAQWYWDQGQYETAQQRLARALVDMEP